MVDRRSSGRGRSGIFGEPVQLVKKSDQPSKGIALIHESMPLSRYDLRVDISKLYGPIEPGRDSEIRSLPKCTFPGLHHTEIMHGRLAENPGSVARCFDL